MHDVTKVYQQGNIQVATLRGISLVLEREQFCFIVGPSGNIDINDKSHLIQLEAVYEISRNAKLSLRLVQFRGDKKSDFGSFLQDQIGTFQVTWDF